MQRKAKCDLYSGNKQPRERVSEQAPMLDLAYKNFKAAVINMFKEMKKKYLNNSRKV